MYCICWQLWTKSAIGLGRKKQVKVGGRGGLWLSGALFHKNRAPSCKLIYGGCATQLSLKLLNSACL